MSAALSVRRRLGFAALTTIAALLLGEGVCRVFGLADDLAFDFHFFVRHVDGDVEETYNQEDAELMWAPRPGYLDGLISITAQGFRGEREVGARAAGVLRVACLGDSSTFGVDVGGAEIWAARLEHALGTAEVINAGVTGYTSSQALRRYERDVRPLKPDVVVLYIGVNDGLARFPLSDDDILDDRLPSAVRALQNAVLLKSHLYRLLRAGVLSVVGRDPLPGPPVPRVSLTRFRDNVARLAALTDADGARLVVVVPPVNPERAAGWPQMPAFVGYRQALVEVASAANAPVIWQRRMDEHARPEGLFIDTVHPSPAGHAVLAEAVADVVRALKVATRLAF